MEYQLESYSVAYTFDSKKVIDSDRKRGLMNLYSDYEAYKGKDFVSFEGEDSKAKFHSYGFAIEEKDLNKIQRIIKSIQKLFSINLSDNKRAGSLSVVYIMFIEDLAEQARLFMRFVKNKNIIISRLEIYDQISEDKNSLIDFKSTSEGVYITYSVSLGDVDNIDHIVNDIECHMKNKIVNTMFEGVSYEF